MALAHCHIPPWLGSDGIARTCVFKLLVLLGVKFNRGGAVPEVHVLNCEALGAAKGAL